MYEREKKYLSIYAIPVLAFISFIGINWWAFLLPFIVFIWVPIAEFFTEQSAENYTDEQERQALADPFYDRLLYTMVPLQYIIVFSGLYIMKEYEWTRMELIGKIFSMGICCGVIGINLGHELGHRVTRYERFMAKALLLTSMYMHFFIEHNKGHHKRVATNEDPATARRGEILYFFWIRSILFSYVSAWKLEAERLRKAEVPFLSLKNEMIQYQLIQIAFVTLIYFIFGLKSMIIFLIAALIGILLLETVNYVEHYGLQRRQSGTKGYERVLPIHSWNSDHKLGRQFLFELTRHSDHHYLASRKYQILRHFDESPQMPFGYPAMILLSTVPPLWFFVMHRHIETHQKLLSSRSPA
jgi:alkane 1-monooxygenase